jgi:hypothetical protein
MYMVTGGTGCKKVKIKQSHNTSMEAQGEGDV